MELSHLGLALPLQFGLTGKPRADLMGDITLLIGQARAGDSDAGRQLFTELYEQLRRIAATQRRRMHSQDGNTTSLVHEVYFRLSKPAALDLRDRAHFYAVAGKAMRHLLIDQVRKRESPRHGEGKIRSMDTLDAEIAPAAEPGLETSDLEALEQAMTRLAELDADLVKLVELRFYAGLTLVEIVEITERSERSLKRDWRKARAFLYGQLNAGSVPLDES